MKKIFLIAAVAGLSVSSAFSQGTPIYQNQLLFGGTNAVLAGTTSNYTVAANMLVLDVRKQANVDVSIQWANDATNLGSTTFTFQRSIDSINWETNSPNTTAIALTNNGTNVSIVLTNLNTQGAGYMRLTSIAQTNAVANFTNVNIQYGIKIQAP